MAVPNPELPEKGTSPLGGQSAGSRPIPLGSGAGQFPGGQPRSNRPIPVQSRSQLPEADDEDEELEEEAGDLREVIKNAPAWLVSTVFHMVLLIVLGLLAVTTSLGTAKLEVEVGYVEDLGKQLENPDVLVSDDNPFEEVVTDPVITPKDLPLVDDPLVAPPVLEELQLTPSAAPTVAGTVRAPGIALALSGRVAGNRRALLSKYGGTAGTEQAVERGLRWLVKQQRSDGSWSLNGPYADGARSENTAAATAMALLAFQGHGDTHDSGEHAKTVAAGWRALLKMQKADGGFTGGQMTLPTQQLYTHAQAMIAVCEMYGMTKDSRFRAAAERAIQFAVESQDVANGGWRYMPRSDSDTSVTGWFVMGLMSARMAGLKVPDETLQRINVYLDQAAIEGGRKYGYWLNVNPTNAVCAEGLLCRQYLGWARDDPRLVEGVTDLLTKPVSYEATANSEVDVYYWYYATQVTHHMEGQIWDEWNKVMRVELPAHQQKSGPEDGSWDPQVDKWGNDGGRLFVTCLSIYNLEVYYRHLPIYSGYRGIESLPPVPAGLPKPEGDAADAAATESEQEKPAAEAGEPTKETTEPADASPKTPAPEKAVPRGASTPAQ